MAKFIIKKPKIIMYQIVIVIDFSEIILELLCFLICAKTGSKPYDNR